MRRKQGRSHLLTKKSAARKRRLASAGLVPTCFVKTFTRLIRGQ